MLCDPIDGTLLAAGTARYRPPGWLRDMVIARAVTCVAPGCTQPAEHCDIDHREPWPKGATCTGNLDPLCRHHHRCKDGGGFTLTRDPDGTYRWRTPLGRIITRPPTRLLHRPPGTDHEPNPDDEANPGTPASTTVPPQERSRPLRTVDDTDPPPF